MANYDVIVRAVDQTKGTFQSIERSLSGIQGMAGKVAGALAGAFTAQQVLQAASAYQKLQTSITGTVGAARGLQIISQLSTQASELGVAVEDLTGAFKVLKSVGIDSSADSLATWAKFAAATGSTVEQIADAVGNVYQGSFGKIGKATNDLIEVENKYGQFVVRVAGQVKASVATTGEVVNVLKSYVDTNKAYADALKQQAQSIDASYKRLNNAVTAGFANSGLDKTIAEFIDKFVKLEQESGAITKTFRLLADGLQFVADNFKLIAGAIAAVGIVALGARLVALGRTIYEIAVGTNKWIAAVVAGKTAIFGFSSSVTAGGKQLGFLTQAFRTVANSIQTAINWFYKAILNFGVLQGSLLAAGAAIGVFGTTLLKLGGLALRFLGGPWGLLIGGVIAFKDEIMSAGRSVLEFFGILEKQKPPTFLSAEENANDIQRLLNRGNAAQAANAAANAAGGAGGKPADTFMMDLIGNFGKARSELRQLQTQMSKTTDINLLAKLFQEAETRAEMFGIVLQKDAVLISRDYSIAIAKTAEELRQQNVQLLDATLTQAKWTNELNATRLELDEQAMKLMDAGYLSKKWNLEIAAVNLQLDEERKKLRDSGLQLDLYANELNSAANALQQQEIRLGMTAQMQIKFRQELQATDLSLAENAQRLADSALQARIFAQEITSAEQALQQSALKLGDNVYQQGLFNNNLVTIRQNTEQQKITLTLLNEAYAAGTISLEEYSNVLGTLSDRLIGVNETQRRALDAANAQLNNTDNSTGAVRNLTQQLRAGTLTWRQYQAAVSKLDSEGVKRSFINIDKEIARAKSTAEVFAETITESATKAGDALADSLTKGIADGKLSLNSFKDFFGSILNDIAQMVIRRNFVNPIVDALTGAMMPGGGGNNILGSLVGGISKGGGFGDVFGSISNWWDSFSFSDMFAGFFADGGLIPGGKVGIVGERGPELITGPANITPMDEFTGTGEPLTVNFTLNAIDTQTGIEFLLKNKPQIVGMIQGAYNSQGKRGIYK